MMNKRWIYVVTVCCLLLAGCAQGKEEQQGSVSGGLPGTVSQPALSEEEKQVQELELRYSQGEASLEDYLKLADIYGEQGQVRRQRDLLEQSYRLFDDTQSFLRLQEITVNLAEEELSIREQAELMLQNLELEEYRDEAVNLISTSQWFDTMMPKLYEGRRSYYLEKNNTTTLVIQIGYGADGTAYSDVWYLKEDGQATMLSYVGNVIQMLTCNITDGIYDGPFESWICNGATGDVIQEQGSFVYGNLSGDYTTKVHTGSAEGEAYSLWCNRRDMDYTTYSGHFDEQGNTTVEQPDNRKMQSLLKDSGSTQGVVYAYNNSKEKCLFIGLEEGQEADTFAFESNMMGWRDFPQFAAYAVADRNLVEENAGGENNLENDSPENSSMDGNMTDTPAVQVRIFDGEVQVLMDGVWVSGGRVEELGRQDPFYVYAAEGGRQSGAAMGSDGMEAGYGTVDVQTRLNTWNRTGGTIPKESTTTTQKPATSKPSSKPTTPSTEPETPSEPAPSTPNPAPSNPSPAPSTPSPAPSTPEPVTPSDPPVGNDVDSEWSVDVLS